MTLLNLNPDELLTTTRAVRKRLDLDRAVPVEVVEECLEVALQAPTGSNAQAWQWIFISDSELKRQLARIYATEWHAYSSSTGVRYGQGDPRRIRGAAVRTSAEHLANHLADVPVLLIPCSAGRVDGAGAAVQAGHWGSILPAVWSFMLALRARGLGSTWTTLHLRKEREVAELLGIPFSETTQAGLLPIAYTKGTSFSRAARLPAASVTHWNHW